MIARLVAIVFLLAGPASATQDAWPALYDVGGVAADDVLNIRAEPNATAPIVGAFRPDQKNIEVIRPSDDEGWGLVNIAEGTGWVSLRFMDRHPDQWMGFFPKLASCFGTEPFWSLQIDGDSAYWDSPDQQAPGQVMSRVSSLDRRDRHGMIVALGDTQITGIIAHRYCSDFMSDREYGLAFDAFMDDGLISGCCTLSR